MVDSKKTKETAKHLLSPPPRPVGWDLISSARPVGPGGGDLFRWQLELEHEIY